ncbi:hypothetical protein ACVXG7_22410 [Enterobacter hormaechei]
MQAFTLNRTVPTMEHAKAILDEMIRSQPRLLACAAKGLAGR